MDAFWSFLGVVIVAIISLIGTVIQSKSHKKLETQEDLIKSVDSKIEALRKESKEDDVNLRQKLDYITMNQLKRFLIVEMTKIKNGSYIPTENQKRMLSEAKDEYNQAGGDSYVDDMYDDLRKNNLL